MADNTQSELIPGNDNPWYRLATTHGEKDSEHDSIILDERLAARNRATWNRYVNQRINDRQKANLIRLGFTADQIDTPLTIDDKTAIYRRFGAMGQPHLNKQIDFSGLIFSELLDMRDFIFPNQTNFKQCRFSKYTYFERAMFLDKADFRQTVFQKSANFKQAAFYRDSKFTGASLFNSADFMNTVSKDYADFTEAAFMQHVDFKTAEFRNCTNFMRTTF